MKNGMWIIFWTAIGIVILLLTIAVIQEVGRAKDRKCLKSVTSPARGTKSERRLVAHLLKLAIPAKAIFHDLYIKKSSASFSQIDLVVPTLEGIIVFEVKDYSGWIFGTGHLSHWTQVLAYGKEKYRFYNPIKQNESHIKALRGQLKQLAHIPFFSVVVFYGECELKEINYVPKGTFITKASRVAEVLTIIKATNGPAPYTDKHEIMRFLEQAVQNGEDQGIQKKHIENINEMLGKDRVFD